MMISLLSGVMVYEKRKALKKDRQRVVMCRMASVKMVVLVCGRR